MEKKIELIRHSLSHVMANAVKDIFKDVKFGIGPIIENGFYYDLDLKQSITPEDLPKIETRMKEIVKQNIEFKKSLKTKAEANKLFKDQPYKLELIKELKSAKATIYTSGEFTDLCAGPHVKSTNEINLEAFKLTKIAGAYWKGNEKNKMLQRIYGIAFESKQELENYLKQIEEAEKRDHRKLGKDLDLFTIDDYVGPGLVLWHPKLSIVREEIELYWRKQHRKRGYQYVYTPHVGLSNLWQTSGHLENFKTMMYPPMQMSLKDKNENTAYYAKPMNCPFHIRIYKSRSRSYRELPLRWCELGSVYRYEESGVLHGMLRVRGFTQDDAHIICTEDQFVDEVNKVFDFAIDLNHDFGFDKLNVYLSVRDIKNKETKYIKNEKIWKFSEKTLEDILKRRKIEYKKDIGGAKFYGPSIDLKVVDSMGREWQGTTIQLDMNLPARLGMTYIGPDGKEHIPIMLHRTLLGSMERFVGTLIEHYAGAFPFWLAPVQMIILPVGKNHVDFAKKIQKTFQDQDFRADVNKSDDTVGKKIREAEMQKIPYIIVVGDKEMNSQNIAVRSRGKKDIETINIDQFIEKIKKELK
jgi:threonyl-tRNA synthetase